MIKLEFLVSPLVAFRVMRSSNVAHGKRIIFLLNNVMKKNIFCAKRDYASFVVARVITSRCVLYFCFMVKYKVLF